MSSSSYPQVSQNYAKKSMSSEVKLKAIQTKMNFDKMKGTQYLCIKENKRVMNVHTLVGCENCTKCIRIFSREIVGQGPNASNEK